MLDPMRFLFSSIAFLSRIPIPAGWQLQGKTEQSSLLSALWTGGIVLGLINALIAWALCQIIPPPLAIALFLPIQLILTGAFHEDGFADVADAMGAYTRERRFEIMRDSRLGTFGTGALATLLLIRWNGYIHLSSGATHGSLAAFLILSGGWMRWSSIVLLHFLPYVHIDGKGIARNMKRPVMLTLWVGLVSLLMLTVFLVPVWTLPSLAALATAILTCFLFFRRVFGGANGDCLGACSIVTEILLLTAFCIIPQS